MAGRCTHASTQCEKSLLLILAQIDMYMYMVFGLFVHRATKLGSIQQLIIRHHLNAHEFPFLIH